jgi:hypothetical protein
MRAQRFISAAAMPLATLLIGCASTGQSHHHDHAAPALAAHVQTTQKCRAGAFTEAANIINSVVEIALALPANTPDRTRAELDTVLYTALQQAKTEVHCVIGTLSFGYDQSYAKGIARGVALARSRGLSADVIALGEGVVAVLEKSAPGGAVKAAAVVGR